MGHLPKLLYAFSCVGKINRKEDNLSLGMDGASSQNFSTWRLLISCGLNVELKNILPGF